jgi:uncharacterized protein (UPF0179 family)
MKNTGPSNNYINCYGETEGYYLDEIEFTYKQCYQSCKTCKIKGFDDTHNCLECNEQYTYQVNLVDTKYKNCYTENPDRPQTDIPENPLQIITSEINTYKSERANTESISTNNNHISSDIITLTERNTYKSELYSISSTL